MIPLPKGVTINYEVSITVTDLTADMMKWYVDQNANIGEKIWHDMRGQPHTIGAVSYGAGRASYKTQDGTTQHLLRFRQEDAGAALMFLLKFNEFVSKHNMKEVENYVY
jgi:hypothetical protein